MLLANPSATSESHDKSVGPTQTPAAIGGVTSAPAAFDADSRRLAVLGSRYDILGEAGHGSMGSVYKARDRETGEVVALKLLKPEIASDQNMMERFKNELLFARKITHKNVCRMYDFNRLGGTAYTSMEFVDGESLRSVLNRFGGLPLRKAIGVALQICSGLKEAHAQGIVHRDLKPENIMIDERGNVKIMDFGIARSMEAATRLTGSMAGTPAYMAPEQVSGKPVDYRTDVYSLGLMLYEMFTGAQAFQAETPVAAALKQIRETPPPPHEVDPTIPVGIERAILKCLEKDPAKRFQSVDDLAKALSAPGLTGSWPGLAGGPEALVSPSHVATARPAAVTPSVQGPARDPRSRRIYPALWLLLGALIVIASLSAARWAKVSREANLIPPPASLPVPKPPAFALQPVITQPAAADAGAASAPKVGPQSGNRPVIEAKSPARSLNADSSLPKSSRSPASVGKSAAPPEIFPPVERAMHKSARQIELEKPPADVQQRANKAFGESGNSGDRYVWVGRFERKEKADEVAETIKKLGLPASSVPRRSWQGRVWVVLAGPFSTSRAPGVKDWLKAQGFSEARELWLPASMRPHEERSQ